MLAFLKTYLDRRKRLSYTMPEFLHRHKDLLIIVCDPKTDEIYAGYNDKMIRGKIGEKDNKTNQKVIKTILKFGRFKTKIDTFFLELQSALHAYNEKAKYFFSGLHDALYAIARANTGKKNNLKRVEE